MMLEAWQKALGLCVSLAVLSAADGHAAGHAWEQQFRLAKLVSKRGQIAQAEALVVQSLSGVPKSAEFDVDRLLILHQAADIFFQAKNYQAAEKHARENLALAEKLFGIGSKEVCSAYGLLISIYSNWLPPSHMKQAIFCATKNVEAVSCVVGTTDRRVVLALLNLASLHYGDGQKGKAYYALERALKVVQRQSVRQRPASIADLCDTVLAFQWQDEDALHYGWRLLQLLPNDGRQPAVQQARQRAAAVLAAILSTQDYSDLTRQYAEAIAPVLMAGDRQPACGKALAQLADFFARNDLPEKAKPLSERSLAILGNRETAADESVQVLQALLAGQTQRDETGGLGGKYQRALALLEGQKEPRRSRLALALAPLSVQFPVGANLSADQLLSYHCRLLLLLAGRHGTPAAALARQEIALQMAVLLESATLTATTSHYANVCQQQFSADDKSHLCGKTLYRLADFYAKNQHVAEAEPLYERALAILISDEKTLEYGMALLHYGFYQCTRTRRYDRADQVFATCLKWFTDHHADPPTIAQTLADWATVYVVQHRYREARDKSKRAVELLSGYGNKYEHYLNAFSRQLRQIESALKSSEDGTTR